MMQDPIYNRIEGVNRPTLAAASVFVLLAAAGLWLAALATELLPLGGEALWAAENALYYLPFLVLPMALYARRHPGLGEALRLNPLPGFSAITLALLGLVSVYLASVLAAAWGAALDAIGLVSPGGLSVPQNERGLALSILTMAAFPAVCEELLFRGFVFSAWETRGTAFATGVTAALFALLHGNLYGLPAYLLVGGIAGFATWALDSVYAGMVYHTVYNAACLVIPYLAANRAEAADIPMGPGLALSIALEFAMLAGLAALMLVSLRLRARNGGIEPIPRIRRPLADRERIALAAALLAMAGSMAIVQILAAG